MYLFQWYSLLDTDLGIIRVVHVTFIFLLLIGRFAVIFCYWLVGLLFISCCWLVGLMLFPVVDWSVCCYFLPLIGRFAVTDCVAVRVLAVCMSGVVVVEFLALRHSCWHDRQNYVVWCSVCQKRRANYHSCKKWDAKVKKRENHNMTTSDPKLTSPNLAL